MSTKSTNQPTTIQKRDPDLANAEIAIKRAAQSARDNARKQGMPVVIYKDGRIQEEDLSAAEGTE